KTPSNASSSGRAKRVGEAQSPRSGRSRLAGRLRVLRKSVPGARYVFPGYPAFGHRIPPALRRSASQGDGLLPPAFAPISLRHLLPNRDRADRSLASARLPPRPALDQQSNQTPSDQTLTMPPSASPYATRPARAAYIGQKLAALYPETPIPLDHKDAYTLLVAVLLSAPFTQIGRAHLPTPAP